MIYKTWLLLCASKWERIGSVTWSDMSWFLGPNTAQLGPKEEGKDNMQKGPDENLTVCEENNLPVAWSSYKAVCESMISGGSVKYTILPLKVFGKYEQIIKVIGNI